MSAFELKKMFRERIEKKRFDLMESLWDNKDSDMDKKPLIHIDSKLSLHQSTLLFFLSPAPALRSESLAEPPEKVYEMDKLQLILNDLKRPFLRPLQQTFVEIYKEELPYFIGNLPEKLFLLKGKYEVKIKDASEFHLQVDYASNDSSISPE